MVKDNQLISIAGDKLPQFKELDQLSEFLNQDPPEQWLKDHPFAKGVKYLPIDKIELMLTKIFQEWRVEVQREGQLLNSIYCTVRLYYLHPTTRKMVWQDGVGAVAIQVDQGKNASDLGAIKSNAIMLGLPAAESYAIKDAAEKIGKIFGADINRKDVVDFSPSYAVDDDAEQKIKAATTVDELQAVMDSLTPADKAKFQELMEAQYAQL